MTRARDKDNLRNYLKMTRSFLIFIQNILINVILKHFFPLKIVLLIIKTEKKGGKSSLEVIKHIPLPYIGSKFKGNLSIPCLFSF